MSIKRYVLVDRNNVEADWEYDSMDDAISDAQDQDKAVIEREYEFSDSELVWTPGRELDCTTWPEPPSDDDEQGENDG